MRYKNFGEVFYIPYESFEDIPLEEFKNLHKQYWRFISDLKLAFKPTIYSSITKKYIYIPEYCFACAYAKRIKKINDLEKIEEKCKYCPLIYRSDIDIAACDFTGTQYNRFHTDIGLTREARSKIAMVIANLEWTDLHK